MGEITIYQFAIGVVLLGSVVTVFWKPIKAVHNWIMKSEKTSEAVKELESVKVELADVKEELTDVRAQHVDSIKAIGLLTAQVTELAKQVSYLTEKLEKVQILSNKVEEHEKRFNNLEEGIERMERGKAMEKFLAADHPVRVEFEKEQEKRFFGSIKQVG